MANEQDEIVIIRRDPDAGWLSGFLVGVAVGAVVGLFRAPGSGAELRQKLMSRASSARQAAQSRLPGGSSGEQSEESAQDTEDQPRIIYRSG